MLFEDLPSELLLDIFSYLDPSDLYQSFLALRKCRFSRLISHMDLSLDLTGISYVDFLSIFRSSRVKNIIFLRLTNQYSHGLLIQEFFSFNTFAPEEFLRLRSLHLDDIIGNELTILPVNLEKLSVKFHKKAQYATQFYRLALTSKSLKECYLIAGYAFDHQTCCPIGSSTIQRLHMAIKTFPNDIFAVLHAFPSLIKLKTRVYGQSSICSTSCLSNSSLDHLNIDLQGSGISFLMLHNELLCYLPQLKSLIYHSHGKLPNDIEAALQLSRSYRRFQFIRKGLSSLTDTITSESRSDLVVAVHQITNQKSARQSLTLHTIPYSEKILSLPYLHWNRIDRSNEICQDDQNVYDRVEHLRINLSECSLSSNFPPCRHVHQLTLISTNDQLACQISPMSLASWICPSSIRHLIVNTSLLLEDFHYLFALMPLEILEIGWCQLRAFRCLSSVKMLSLMRECVSRKEIDYLINRFIPHLEHLQLNVTTSEQCRLILNLLLSPEKENHLRSIKICICQTLSDQIQEDLQPLFLSSQWIPVKWRMDSWYLYIWK